MRGAAGGRKSLNRRVSEPDFGKKALPVTQNFQPGKVREVVADWNKGIWTIGAKTPWMRDALQATPAAAGFPAA